MYLVLREHLLCAVAGGQPLGACKLNIQVRVIVRLRKWNDSENIYIHLLRCDEIIKYEKKEIEMKMKMEWNTMRIIMIVVRIFVRGH